MVDGDDTYPAEATSEMVKLVLENNLDMVVGIWKGGDIGVLALHIR